MLTLKAFHVIFMVTWFAGLFYLPRLFIYHTQSSDAVSRQRFTVMERRLLVMTHIGGALTVASGTALAIWIGRVNPLWFTQNHWFHLKLLLVLVLLGYHAALMGLTRRFAQGDNPRPERWLRFFNEVPSLLLVVIVLLAITKPF